MEVEHPHQWPICGWRHAEVQDVEVEASELRGGGGGGCLVSSDLRVRGGRDRIGQDRMGRISMKRGKMDETDKRQDITV